MRVAFYLEPYISRNIKLEDSIAEKLTGIGIITSLTGLANINKYIEK